VDQGDRHDIEREKWDAHARDTRAASSLGPADVLPPGTTFEGFTRGAPLWAGVAGFLGDLRERRVLEYGCGQGKLSVLLARSGARVTTFDLSAASIDLARRRAELNGVDRRIAFHVATGESLPFEAGAFDLAIGKAILHHLDPTAGARELARVMRPGGRAAFSEPLGTNPLLVFARAHLPYPRKHPRGADRPLTAQDLRIWRAPFAEVTLRPVQLLSMVERAVGARRIGPLRLLDDALLARFPGLAPLCRYGVLCFRARPAELR
jgi:2-polyprenyl-3-methyl-5-hydroxy-6-metoxy-1,4-benzoquinol methylase